jgi:hypothetical protein
VDATRPSRRHTAYQFFFSKTYWYDPPHLYRRLCRTRAKDPTAGTPQLSSNAPRAAQKRKTETIRASHNARKTVTLAAPTRMRPPFEFSRWCDLKRGANKLPCGGRPVPEKVWLLRRRCPRRRRQRYTRLPNQRGREPPYGGRRRPVPEKRRSSVRRRASGPPEACGNFAGRSEIYADARDDRHDCIADASS